MTNPDSKSEIVGAFVDIAALTKATTFLGNKRSGFSKCVRELRKLEALKTPHILTSVFKRL